VPMVHLVTTHSFQPYVPAYTPRRPHHFQSTRATPSPLSGNFPGATLSQGMVAAMDAAPDRSVDAGGILGAMSAAKESPVSAETELVERARAGDRQAFDRLTEMHLPRVWRVVWGVLRHREDTEDIVQEVFLTAYRSLPDYRAECSLSTWLHRIAVTRALNHLDLAAEKVRRSSLPIEPSWEDPDPGSSSP